MNRNESETRAELISPKLTADGWGVHFSKIVVTALFAVK